MYCLRCGTKVDDNVEYCPHCGANIREELARYDYKPKENPPQKPAINLEPSHEEQFQYSIKYSFGNEKELIKEYVGKNYDKIKNTKFSLPAFFLGPIYFFYRKLYTYAFIWILVIIMFGFISPIFGLLIQIGFSVSFSKIYLEDAKRKVIEIQRLNKDLSKEAIIEQCRKKGGVNIIIPTLIIIAILSIIILIISAFWNEIKPEQTLKKPTTYQIENLEYTIPKGFIGDNYNSDNYKSYSYEKDYHYCRIYFSTINNYIYDNKEEYLKSGLTDEEKSLPVDTKTINGETWIHLNITDEYSKEDIYVVEKGSKLYRLNTYTSSSAETCDKQFNNLLDSINYKE